MYHTHTHIHTHMIYELKLLSMFSPNYSLALGEHIWNLLVAFVWFEAIITKYKMYLTHDYNLPTDNNGWQVFLVQEILSALS